MEQFETYLSPIIATLPQLMDVKWTLSEKNDVNAGPVSCVLQLKVGFSFSPQ